MSSWGIKRPASPIDSTQIIRAYQLDNGRLLTIHWQRYPNSVSDRYWEFVCVIVRGQVTTMFIGADPDRAYNAYHSACLLGRALGTPATLDAHTRMRRADDA